MMMMMVTVVMMIIGCIVVIVASSGCLIPSANYGGESTKWHRHFTLMVDGDDDDGDDDDDDCDDGDDDVLLDFHPGVLCRGELYVEAPGLLCKGNFIQRQRMVFFVEGNGFYITEWCSMLL